MRAGGPSSQFIFGARQAAALARSLSEAALPTLADGGDRQEWYGGAPTPEGLSQGQIDKLVRALRLSPPARRCVPAMTFAFALLRPRSRC